MRCLVVDELSRDVSIRGSVPNPCNKDLEEILQAFNNQASSFKFTDN